MNQESPPQDVLAGIAARGASQEHREQLVLQNPPVLSDIRLPGPAEGDGLAFTPLPETTAESLAADLAQAREDFAPFLADLSPAPPCTRRSQTIQNADWRLEPAAAWQAVELPHYGGPLGRARSWYRMEFHLDEDDFTAGSVWACFGGVDYKAAVFANGSLVGTHEGFFSPFDFEITREARVGTNELLVRVDNDAICHGNDSWGDRRAGDKIYAATGLGWDEAGSGWHHCPPGMGIPRPVRIEARPRVHLKDLFARPLPAEDAVELHVDIHNCDENPVPFHLEVAIHGLNFEQDPVHQICEDLPEAGAGFNRYRIRVPLPAARLWSPETPWLYQARATLNGDGPADALARPFGMRTFLLDEAPGPDGRKGRFFLNGKPIRLRGANTMGHEQQCVLQGDLDQLRDDLLLARLANMNYLRLTQRPVEREVYDMCDRLGIMVQCDLPLFGYLRRNQFSEAVRQSAEMERLVRCHPSVVLASFINEPFPAAWGDKSHRHLTRTELENFFVAATHAIHVENPDRQIKAIDGDYEPPGPGLPDNHCYAGWYNGHGLDLGMVHKGFWVPVKPGWNYACGEYGSEGIDFTDLMRERYPASWLPQPGEAEAAWTPKRIHCCQTGDLHYLWLEPADTMDGWVRRSQAHQTWITRLMTEAFRRDNRMVSFAIHLFIDAWPAGWMKTIMDCRRRPKPAYFAFRNALAPLAASCRMDRTAGFSGESLEAEAWVCNDPATTPAGVELVYQIERGGRVTHAGRVDAVIRPCEAVFQGRVRFVLPAVAKRETIQLRLGLVAADGTTLHDTCESIEVFPVPLEPSACAAPHVAGTGKARQLADELKLDATTAAGLWLADEPAALEDPAMLAAVANGATALILELPPGTYQIAGASFTIEEAGMEKRHFVSRNPHHPVAAQFTENDFRFWHDPECDRVTPLLDHLMLADEADWSPILRTGQGGWGCQWKPAMAVAERPHGAGRIIICQLKLAGRLANPSARLFAHALPARQTALG